MNASRVQRVRALLQRRQPDLTVLAERVRQPHNFGAIVRTADAVGASTVHAVPDVGDILGDGQLRFTAKGSDRWVDVVTHATVQDAFQALRGQGMQIFAADLNDRAIDYRQADFTKPTCVVMGKETSGISDFVAEQADQIVAIPIVGMVESLNVSVAASVLLYEALRQREAAGMYRESRMPEDEIQHYLVKFLQPQVFAFCERHGLPLPRLDEDGLVDDPAFDAARRAMQSGRRPAAGP